tara:strand:- start:594 stop:755 length:162 start_codon:yes stop_codon:yes gene_type:complete
MTTYEVEFEELDLHWIVYKVTDDDHINGNKRIPMMRFVNREQAEEYVEVILKI